MRVADLYRALYDVGPNRLGWRWVMSTATLNELRRIRVGDEGGPTTPIMTPPMSPDGSWMLLGQLVELREEVGGVQLVKDVL